VSPWGEILGDGAGGEEQVLLADVDPAVVTSIRERYPFLRDRRVP
jgi:predicted amidohydrolase